MVSARRVARNMRGGGDQQAYRAWLEYIAQTAIDALDALDADTTDLEDDELEVIACDD